MSTDLSDLIRRVESASDGDRWLDGLLYGWANELEPNLGGFMMASSFQYRHPTLRHPAGPAALYVREDDVPAYTASLDAALALVERVLPGWWWVVQDADAIDPDTGHLGGCAEVGPRSDPLADSQTAMASTPALALILALLRALPTQRNVP